MKHPFFLGILFALCLAIQCLVASETASQRQAPVSDPVLEMMNERDRQAEEVRQKREERLTRLEELCRNRKSSGGDSQAENLHDILAEKNKAFLAVYDTDGDGRLDRTEMELCRSDLMHHARQRRQARKQEGDSK